MNINDAFPSKYLSASDLGGRTIAVTINHVAIEEIGQGADKDRKLVISFAGKQKQFVCNKTNARTIESLYGSDTDGWIGQQIAIGPREVEFQGKMVMAIRVSLQRPPSSALNAKPAPVPVSAPAGEDEDVPF